MELVLLLLLLLLLLLYVYVIRLCLRMFLQIGSNLFIFHKHSYLAVQGNKARHWMLFTYGLRTEVVDYFYLLVTLRNGYIRSWTQISKCLEYQPSGSIKQLERQRRHK